MRIIKLIALLIAMLVGWIIGWSNHEPITFKFLIWQLPEIPVFGLYFLFLLFGLLLGLVLGRFARRS